MAETHDAFKLTPDEQFIIDQCVKVEEKCADLYRHFATLYTEFPDLVSLWRTIASEEDDHAEAFRLAVRLKGVGVESVNYSAKNVELLQEIEHLLDTNSPAQPSPVEALQFAINLEKNLGEFHIARCIINFNDVALKRVFAENMHATNQHITMLEKALGRMI